MEDEDFVRQPDNVVREQLLNDDRSEFQKQIDEAIYLSVQELNNQRILYKEFEDQLVKDYTNETNRRTELFKDFLFNLNKIGKFDREVQEIFNILDPIIESYCNQFIQTCEMDQETYDKIFNTLRKIRNQTTVDILKSIVLTPL